MRTHKQDWRYLWPAVILLFVLTLFRFWFCTTFELAGDEAYYWLWSKHLDWCYYSKGPLVAWTIALGTRLFGDTVFGIRFFAVALGTGTAALIWLLAARLHSAKVALWTVIVVGLTPLFTAGGFLMTIDPLSVFFWAAAALVFWETRRSDTIWPWICVGLLIGAGALAKYTNLALILCFGLYLGVSPQNRRHLSRPTFWTMTVAALVCLLPVVVWNTRHDWITLEHLLNRGALDRPWRFSPREFLVFLGGQTAVYFPLFFAGLWAAVFAGIPHNLPAARRDAVRYLLCLTLPLFVLYSVLATNNAGEANWTAPAFVGGAVLLAATWHRWSQNSIAARRVSLWSIAIAAAFTVAFLAAVNGRLPTEKDPLRQIHGWRSLAAQVAAFAAENQTAVIISDGYQPVSLLSFYLPRRFEVFHIRAPGIANQFSFWPTYGVDHAGSDAVFVSLSDSANRLLRDQFETIGPPREAVARHRGAPVRPFYLYACRKLTEPGGE